MTDQRENDQLPLLTVGIPIFNGATTIRRTIQSITGQSYGNWEIIISDNGSTDETQSICLEYAESDRRIKYRRHPKNLGASANFSFCLNQAGGEYFMWCAADDQVTRDYAEACIAALADDPATVLVGGRTRYVDYRGNVVEGAVTELVDLRGLFRVLRYFSGVSDNGILYGVYRRRAISGCSLRNMMGGDWVWLAEVAYLGKVRTLPCAVIQRDDSWANTTSAQYYRRIARAVGAPPLFSRLPRLAIAIGVGSAIYGHSKVFKAVPRLRRLALSIGVVVILLARAARETLAKWSGRLVFRKIG